MKQKFILLFLKYLRELAKLQLVKIRPTIVGVTGSTGKTSVRNAIAAILRDRFRVKVSVKANSETGLPLNILDLKPKDYSFLDWLLLGVLAPVKLITNWEGYDIYVAEMGIDRPQPPKNMGYLLTILRPTIGVFLNAAAVHSQYFDELVPKNILDLYQRREKLADLIAAEKGKLIKSLPNSGTAVLNLDDPRVAKFVKQTKARVITFATQESADLEASNVDVGISRFSMEVREGKDKKKLKINQILDEHYAQTFLAALAVGRAFAIPLSQGLRSLEKNFHLPRGRMSLIPGKKGTRILDSSYNASRVTLISALKLLNKVSPGRKLAVLGDMRELGEVSKLEHQSVARVAAQSADFIIAVGPQMRSWFVPELKKIGFPEKRVRNFLNPYNAAREAQRTIRKGDTILVKGSQNLIFLEIVVKALMRNPEDAQKLLCRRGKFWETKRQELKRQLD